MNPKDTLFMSYTDTDGTKGYKIEVAAHGALTRKSGKLEGAFGYPDVYFDRIDLPLGTKVGEKLLPKRLLILTAIGKAMTPELRDTIIAGAVHHAQKVGGLKLNNPNEN